MTHPLSTLTRLLLGLDNYGYHYGSNHSVVWRPLADIYHCGDEQWLLKVELAGVKVEDIRLEVRGQRLVLQGVRLDRRPRDHMSHTMEIAYNRFERVFEFSRSLEKANIRTEYLDGMLHIYLHTGGNR